MKPFESFLAPQLNDYLTYRQSLGYGRWPTVSYLRTFDRYLRKTKRQWTLLQPSFFLEFRARLTMEPRSVNSVLSATRNFFQYLVRRGYYPQNPLKDIALLSENAIIPFVFSPEQIEHLLRAICTRVRRFPEWFLKDLSVYLAVVLLARCGMRISEPLKLMRNHYRKDDGTLYIEKTKFKKQRLIPAPKAVMTEIDNYLSVRKALKPRDDNPYLLMGNNQGPLKDVQLRNVFHKALKQIGIDQRRRVINNVNFTQPAPHSLRHSFAVNTLMMIKERGKSPQHALPVLAAYMGHSEYKYSSVYLRVADAQSRKNLVDFSLWQKRKQ